MKRLVCLCLVLFGGVCAGKVFAAERSLRIRVFSRYQLGMVEVSAPGLQGVLRQANQVWKPAVSPPEGRAKILASGAGLKLEEPDLGEGSQLILSASQGPLTVSDGKGLQRQFIGRLRIENRGGALFFIEELPLENYVRGVLASELPSDFPLEAQKAQAVLIRSYALANAPRHAEEGYDFCDLTHCQAYGGWNSASALRAEAVRATRGLVLEYHGKPIEALFHSTCGGHTSPNQDVFGGRALPYLQGVDDENFCHASPHFNWESQVTLERIAELLRADPRDDPHGKLRGLHLEAREAQGRGFTLAVEGEVRKEIPVMEFLSLMGKGLGWNQLKSNWFEVELRGDTAYFQGRGLGHGVGMCQWGARGMAEAGNKFDVILRHYFPGTQLKRRP